MAEHQRAEREQVVDIFVAVDVLQQRAPGMGEGQRVGAEVLHAPLHAAGDDPARIIKETLRRRRASRIPLHQPRVHCLTPGFEGLTTGRARTGLVP